MKLGYYNLAHFLMIAVAVIQFLVIFFTLRKRSDRIKTNVLLIILSANAVLFIVYKVVMGFTFEDFEILNELPLHLCNLNVVLLPVAVKTKNKFLCSYLFYVGTIAALAGVLFFDSLFEGRNIFNFVVFVYFFYHSIMMSVSVLIPSLNIYRPKFLDIFFSLATLVVLCLCMHTVNVIFRATEICTISNYFYTYGLDGNPLMDALYSLISVPVLYMLPIVPLLILVNTLMYLPFARKKAIIADKGVPA